MDKPVEMIGLDQSGLVRQKVAPAQMIDQAFDHPFMRDDHNGFPAPASSGFMQCSVASLAHTQTIFSTGRAKMPARLWFILQYFGSFRFNLANDLTCPLAPILFS